MPVVARTVPWFAGRRKLRGGVTIGQAQRENPYFEIRLSYISDLKIHCCYMTL